LSDTGSSACSQRPVYLGVYLQDLGRRGGGAASASSGRLSAPAGVAMSPPFLTNILREGIAPHIIGCHSLQFSRVPQMGVNALRIGRPESIDGQICHTMGQYGDSTVYYSRIGGRYLRCPGNLRSLTRATRDSRDEGATCMWMTWRAMHGCDPGPRRECGRHRRAGPRAARCQLHRHGARQGDHSNPKP